MRKLIGKFYFWLIGWKLCGHWPKGVQSAVIVAAPHTSTQDYIIGVMGFWQRGLHPNILIKQEAFKGLQGWVLRKLGCVPVNRGRSGNLIGELARLMHARGNLKVVFTPEGTRQKTERWRTGFYFLALKAGVPIVTVYTDYGRRQGGYGKVFYPTGDMAADFAAMRRWYEVQDFKGKYPEQSDWSLYPPENWRERIEQLGELQEMPPNPAANPAAKVAGLSPSS